MITSKGKSVIAKYLIGETPSYASYIAVGCGPKPVDSNVPFSANQKIQFAQKKNLDLEMFRVPVISRGYIVETDSTEITNAVSALGVTTYTAKNFYTPGQKVTITGVTPEAFNATEVTILSANSTTFSISKTVSLPTVYVSGGVASVKVSQIVLTAEMPTEERYEITELGIYPALSNPDAGNLDSRQIFNFSKAEGWENHALDNVSAIDYKTESIDQQSSNNIIDFTNSYGKVFSAKSSNSALATTARILRQERPRYLEDSIFLRGDLSISGALATTPAGLSGKPHIHLKTTLPSLDRATPIDSLTLGFSVISRSGNAVINPNNVKILVEFSAGDYISGDPVETNPIYARLPIDLSHSLTPTGSQRNFIDGRYVTVSTLLEDLDTSPNFSWLNVDTIKIYTQVVDSSSANSDQFYVALDALRFENNTAENPLYGLVGYSVIKNQSSKPIAKDSNKSGFIEFRYAVDVS